MFDDWDQPSGSVKDQVEALQAILLARSTGGDAHPVDYAKLREYLLKNAEIGNLLPAFVRNCRTLDQFWALIKTKFGTYSERRLHIWEEFRPVFDRLETNTSPLIPVVSDVLEVLDADHVKQVWERALKRIDQEPDAAVTSARTMLESLYKTLLDECGVDYPNDVDLPKLHRLVMEQLKLTPEQPLDQALKIIFGNIQSIVQQLAAIRNKASDSHGHGRDYYQPTAQIAEFVVNLAGSLAILIVQVYKAR